MFTSRVDDKGRLKLPADVQRYLESTDARQVFVTSFDGLLARIYSIPEWEGVEALLEAPGEGSTDGAGLLYKANVYGGDAEVDSQGRILLPPVLRRSMGVENQPVRLMFSRGHLEVFGEAVHEKQMAGAEENADQKVRMFVDRGLR